MHLMCVLDWRLAASGWQLANLTLAKSGYDAVTRDQAHPAPQRARKHANPAGRQTFRAVRPSLREVAYGRARVADAYAPEGRLTRRTLPYGIAGTDPT